MPTAGADRVARKRASPEDAAKARVAFGERLRAARVKAGWKTIQEAADAAGMHRVVLTQLERGRSSPSVATLETLIVKLKMDPRDLFPYVVARPKTRDVSPD